jgi:hypothetical protein
MRIQILNTIGGLNALYRYLSDGLFSANGIVARIDSKLNVEPIIAFASCVQSYNSRVIEAGFNLHTPISILTILRDRYKWLSLY